MMWRICSRLFGWSYVRWTNEVGWTQIHRIHHTPKGDMIFVGPFHWTLNEAIYAGASVIAWHEPKRAAKGRT